MKTFHLAKILLAASTIFCAVAAENPKDVPIACNLKGFTPDERHSLEKLGRTLFSSVEERRSLSDGYSYRIDTSKVPLASIGEWIAYERRCCPFLRFRLDVGEDTAVWLSLTGRAGVKEFIESEFKR